MSSIINPYTCFSQAQLQHDAVQCSISTDTVGSNSVREKRCISVFLVCAAYGFPQAEFLHKKPHRLSYQDLKRPLLLERTEDSESERKTGPLIDGFL